MDIAIGLGAIPPPWPEIVALRQFAENPVAAPPQIIEGVLQQACKMALGHTRTRNKN